MRFLTIIIFFICFEQPSFAQWQSYYPENKTYKKTEKKPDLENQKKKYDTYFFKAIKARSLEEYDKAIDGFNECIKINKNNPTPYYELALIYIINNNYNLSKEKIKKAIELDSKNKWYLLLYADLLFKQQDFFNAAIQYKKLIVLDSENEELYFKLSEVYIYNNKIKKAIQVYDDLERKRGTEKMLSMQKQKLYRQINDIDGAIDELQKILKTFTNDIEVIEILAELYLLKNQKEKAFTLFKKISLISPNNCRVHLTLADYYRENEENENSYNELKQAFKCENLNIDTKIRILVSYYQLISIDKEMASQAHELARILIETHPENTKARIVYADVLYTDNKFQESKEQYLIVLENEKSKSQIWTQVLFIQAEQSDFKGMLKTSKEALDYFPLEPLFYYFHGVSNKWFKKYKEALISFETGIDFVVDNSNLLLEFYSSLADIYHIQKKHNLSDKYYEKALEIDSQNVLILNNYAYYLSLRKENLDKAKEMSFRSNQLEPNNGTYQDTYAWVLYQMNEFEEAKEWLLKAMENGGAKSAVIVEHYGDALYRLGDLKEALKQWIKARDIGGGSDLLEDKIKNKKIYE